MPSQPNPFKNLSELSQSQIDFMLLMLKVKKEELEFTSKNLCFDNYALMEYGATVRLTFNLTSTKHKLKFLKGPRQNMEMFRQNWP